MAGARSVELYLNVVVMNLSSSRDCFLDAMRAAPRFGNFQLQ